MVHSKQLLVNGLRRGGGLTCVAAVAVVSVVVGVGVLAQAQPPQAPSGPTTSPSASTSDSPAPVCQNDGRDCTPRKQQKVVGASSSKDAETYFDMPAGNPVGLLTVYCDYGDTTRLRCEDWVNKALRPATR